jgi:hypothetical protein
MDRSIMAFTGPKCSTNTCQVNNQVLVPKNTTNVLKSVENITDGRFLPYITKKNEDYLKISKIASGQYNLP